ncbi:MAG TPA: NUDIX hydrolase N-terminal domain-containing protein [Anaerolineae bacterium]
MDITPQLSLWVQQLVAVAQTGMAFNPPVYDLERYETVLAIAATMAAAVNSSNTIDPALAEQFAKRWRAEVVDGVPGYVTPKVGIGAAVFNEREEMLLIQRSDGTWFYPTGWGDIGLSPAQIAVKEVREEAGLWITPQRLVGIYNSVKWHAELNPHYYSIVFECRLDGGEMRPHPPETLDVGFFDRDHMPQPVYQNRTDHLERAWAMHRGEIVEPYFDPA